MSRKGKQSITVPKDVKVNIADGSVNVEGPKGKLSFKTLAGINLKIENDRLNVERESDLKQYRANHGTARSIIQNMIDGVSTGHKKDLEIQGIGFRAQLQGKKIQFNLGLSHDVFYEIPEDVKVTVPSQTAITVEGIDKIRVGQVAATIRAIKPVEPYKGKGIRYVGEVVRRKQGKSVAK